jgi:predicted nucleic-acid-binding protein
MTTTIVVDAHAGWDVEVLVRAFSNDGKTQSVSTHVVPKFTAQSFWISTHMEIIGIRELKLE